MFCQVFGDCRLNRSHFLHGPLDLLTCSTILDVPPRQLHASARHNLIEGSVIDAIDQRDFSDPKTLRIAKRIARESIKYHLSGKELNTKKVVKSLKKMI